MALRSLMAELRYLLVIVTWPAAEKVPRPVVALTPLTCTTSLAPAFLRLEAVAVAAVAATGQSLLFFLGSQQDGAITPAGCKFFFPLFSL